MLKNLKISVKLLVIVALLSIVAVSTISYVGIYTAKKSTIDNQITMLEHIADLKVNKIESFFNERSGDIKVVQDYFNVKTNLPIVTRFAADRTNPAYISARKMLDDQVKTFIDTYRCYVDFTLVSPEGNVVYSINELHENIDLDNPLTGPEGEKAFEQGKKGVYFSDIYVSEFEDYVYGMLITAPVHGFEGQFIGVVALELNMCPIYEFIQDITGLGETGETLIGKKVEDGALFLNLLRHDKDAALKRKAIFGEKSASPIMEAVQGRNGSGLSIDYREKEIIAAWRNIPSLDWGLAAKIDLEEALAPVHTLKKTVFYIACFIIALGLTGAFLLSISITRPVKKLSDTVLKIIKGDLSQRVDIKSRDEIGLLAGSFNIMTDKLIMAADYTNNIIKSMTDTLIVVSPDATIRTVNQATLNLLGYREDELIGKPVGTIFAEEEEEEELFKKSGIQDLIKKGFIRGIEKTYHSKEGRKIPMLFSGSVMRDDQGEVQGIVCAASDITERKQLEESLASEKERLGVTLHSIGDGVIATDHEGKIVILNKVAQKLTGWSQEDASGKQLTEVFHIINEKTREIVENPVGRVLKDGATVLLANHTVLIARDGTERIIADSAAPILDRKNDIIGVVLAFRDVTECKRLEEERQDMQLKMMQSSKLASLGEIATGIAHEINQPLTYINSFVSRLQEKLEHDTINRDVVKEKDEAATSLSQIDRITNIISHLRTFGRADDMDKQQVSIETILNNTLLLMGERIRLRNIELKKDIKPDLPMISGSPTQLEQVFINLFQNAMDAFPKKPKDAVIVVDISSSKDKDLVVIKVADNGMGIDQKNLGKIFEPFFTTKEVGKGTGLGLSIVYGIIREHNGSISCESEVGKGTTFTITLLTNDSRKKT